MEVLKATKSFARVLKVLKILKAALNQAFYFLSFFFLSHFPGTTTYCGG